jgi:quercetin dioxygenase-like cupin family protein
MTLAEESEGSRVRSEQVFQRDIIEELDGKDARVTVRLVTIEPGQKDSAHRHTDPVFGYVLEGEYEHAMDDGPSRLTRQGRHSTNRRGLCTGWPKTLATKPERSSSR